MVIRRIGPLSAGKIAAVIYAAFGLIIGAIFSLVAITGGLASDETEGAAFGAIFGIGAVILLPLLYGGLGFVSAVLGAWFYNLAAGVVGGLEIEAP